MTKWWFCPQCNVVTDEFESTPVNKCPKCREEEKEKEKSDENDL